MISILLGIPGDILSSGEYALTRVRKACHATRISKMIPRVRVQSLGPEAVRIIQRILEEIGILWRVVEQTRRINQWRIRTKLSLSTNDFSRSDFLFHFMHESFYFSDFFFSKNRLFSRQLRYLLYYRDDYSTNSNEQSHSLETEGKTAKNTLDICDNVTYTISMIVRIVQDIDTQLTSN